ncbi:MAG: OmpA family protein [Bacteroidota bacterium]
MKLFLLYISTLLYITFAFAQEEIIIVEELPFNTSMFNEFSPISYYNSLCFTSNKAHPFLKTLKDKNGERLYNIYFVEKRENLSWKIPRLFSRDITSPFNEGSPSFNNNFSKMIFSRNIISDSTSINKYYYKDNTVGLFISNKTGNQWNLPEKLPFVIQGFNYLHPFWFNDSLLFFSSDLPGGEGGSDIYYALYIDGNWSEPVNAGFPVNTDSNEVFPYYHSGNRLYFSSDRQNGNGGYDIYYSEKVESGWKKPVPLPVPLNSTFNDFSFICDSTQENGYFSSDRSGSDDIYSYKMNWPAFNNCDSLKLNNYCFTFYEKGNYDLDTMPLRYEWDIAGIKKVRDLEADHCFDGPGLYIIALNIIDTLTQEVFYNQATYEFVIEDIEQVYITAPDTCETSKTIMFDGAKTNLKNVEIDQYYWEFGDGDRALGITVNHSFEKPGTYSLLLGTKGKKLDGTIINACVIKDITVADHYSPSALIAVILADTSAILTLSSEGDHEKPELNEFNIDNDIIEDKVYKVEVTKSAEKISLEDEYFDTVREIYTIMENYVSTDSSYSYTVGNETDIFNTYPIFMKIKSLGYMDAQVKSFNIVPDSITVSDTLAKILLNNLLSQWKSIHFDYNKYTISPESFEMLNKVYNVLNKYETLIIEIAAHTDDIGTNDYNIELSEKRAQAVTDYLVEKGIDIQRLKPKGYGKTKPLFTERNESARAQNRRVEFIVLKTGLN